MKKLFAWIFLVMILFPVSAEDHEDFSGVVDFTVTLKILNSPSFQELEPQSDQYFILTGAITERRVVNSDPDDPEAFVGEIEIVDGEWFGLENVVMYRCIIRLSGSEFKDMIPARRTRRPKPEEIPLNTQVLIIGKLIGYLEEGSVKIPIIEGIKLRIL